MIESHSYKMSEILAFGNTDKLCNYLCLVKITHVKLSILYVKY